MSGMSAPVARKVSVALRWEIDYPDGGSSTFTATRVSYPDLASAEVALDRIRRYAPVDGFVY
jgi:hypothetical protein